MHFFLKPTIFLFFCTLLITVNAQAGNITASEEKCVYEETGRLVRSDTGEGMQQDLQALGVKCGSEKQSELIDVIVGQLLAPVMSSCFKDKEEKYKQLARVESTPIIISTALPHSCIQLDQ
ncbi:MAG: hypothetical protein WGN25_14570 [Candidatus Electrothrix sp. GW3-4]|uniref:hypothetical protein n=1 Tax=Candidatus Electrothrix sp. GW3-4 TaxID=3126740 RepID=UPI0030CC862D